MQKNQEMTNTLREIDIKRLKNFNGYADSLFDRNWAIDMEKQGYLEEISGDLSGGRSYELTDKGKELTNN